MRPYLLYIADTRFNDAAASRPQSVITLILSAVFFRSKKSGNCILYLAIEYFSVFPQPEGLWPSDCSLQSSLCQNVKDLVAAD